MNNDPKIIGEGAESESELEETKQDNPIPFLLELCDFGGPYETGEEFNH